MYYFNDSLGIFRFDGSTWHGIGSNAPTGAPYNGVTETGISIAGLQPYCATVNRTNDQDVFACDLWSPLGLLRRSGTNWARVAGLPNNGLTNMRSLVQSIAAPTTFLALPFDSKPVISLNSGGAWSEVTVTQFGFERLRFYNAAPNPANANVWLGGTNKGVFRSPDGGSTWSRVNMAPFQRYTVPAVGWNASGTVALAGDADGNRYCSTDGGVNWQVKTGKLNAGINAIKTANGTPYFLTDGAGLFREAVTPSCP
jgi:hypothetical protein